MTAGRRRRKVVVLERNPDIGTKIRISGGGRCNFTNVSADLRHAYHSMADDDGGFYQKVLARYPPERFIALVESHGIRYHEKKLGQLFCDRSARQLVEMLREECEACGVRIVTNSLVDSVVVENPTLPDGGREASRRYVVSFRRGSEDDGAGQEASSVLPIGSLRASKVIVATGGLSYARTCGATDLAHRVAQDFGLQVAGVRPGLVPLLLPGDDEAWTRQLAGVSLRVRASAGDGPAFEENLLFTHRGLSGPAILQVSSYCFRGHETEGVIHLDLVPGESREELQAWLARQPPGLPVARALSRVLPSRLAEALWAARGAAMCGARAFAQLGELDAAGFARLSDALKGWHVRVVGTEGYPKAEVTCGGVATSELNGQTLEALKHPGLYFAGEAVDVTGWLGGYNLQWAWASGFAAGSAC